MRFSDMMGSGEERSAPVEADSAVSDALAPYLDNAPAQPTAPMAPITAAPAAPIDTAVGVEAAIAPAPVETAPVAISEPHTTAFVDFTPLSDDILPRRR